MPTKRQVLDLLTRDELLTYLDQFELAVPDRRVKDAIVDSLAAAHRVQLDQLLLGLKRVQLQEMCRNLGLDDSGREKALLVERLAGRAGKRVDGKPATAAHAVQAELPNVTPPPHKKPRTPVPPSPRPSAAPRRPTRPPRASTGPQPPIAPGSRILVRDAEWLVRRVDSTSTGGKAFSVVGISEIVRDKEAIFLDEIEKPVVLDPADTRIAIDTSPHYRASLLYMESLLRQTAPTDDNLYVGHRAAMDPVPYQLDPALQALEQTRQRILIADAVGLGKGRIVFTNSKGLVGVGLPRTSRDGPCWDDVKSMQSGTVEQTVMDDTLPGGPRKKTIVYHAPFDRCDRERDYEVVWAEFEKRYGKVRTKK